MNIIILEDDTRFRNKVKDMIIRIMIQNNLTDCDISLATSSPTEVLKYAADSNAASVYFLDIQLEDERLSGLDIANEIRKSDSLSEIVFITSFSEHQNKAFKLKLKALDYILKYTDNLYEDIKSCLFASYKRLTKNTDEQFIFQTKFGAIKYNYNAIWFIQSQKQMHKSVLVTKNSTEEIPCTLKDVQDILPHYFVRCHRTIIVNSTKIIGMDTRESTLVLENEITVPYSRANTKELKGTFFKKEKAE